MTNSVMLCEGSVAEIALLEIATLPVWLIAVCDADEICQASAVPVFPKLARLMVTLVLPVCLLTTITVSAPSEARTAANDERESGFDTPAETLVSPKVDSLPSKWRKSAWRDKWARGWWEPSTASPNPALPFQRSPARRPGPWRRSDSARRPSCTQ